MRQEVLQSFANEAHAVVIAQMHASSASTSAAG
jgi:hypothetical protein